MNQTEHKIAFIGGGNMAQAIIRGLIAAGHPPGNLYVTDPDATQQQNLQALSFELQVGSDNAAAVHACNIIVLAVKPQIMASVAKALADEVDTRKHLLISIAAGTTLRSLASWLGADARIVRVMPNQPALIGAGMSGLSATANIDPAGREAASYVMNAAGEIRWFEAESQLDAVTAVSGSGPAYYYLLMEIMQEIAEEFGFDTETARLLSVQTALGAGQVASNSDEALAQLRERVTSPGGTTAAALTELERAGIRAIFRKALHAAKDRSIELGQLGQ